MTSQPVPPEFLTVIEVASLFSRDPRTINRWVKRGKLTPTFIDPGGHARFRRSDILALTGDNAEITRDNGA